MNQTASPRAATDIDDDSWLHDPRGARAINAFAVEFAIKYMREAAHLFDGDYESAMIFLAVLEANGRHNVRSPEFIKEYADVRVSLPVEMARPVSRQAIAQSLGLSRETVRRKIATLISRGLLTADDRGGVITARGAIAGEAFLAAQRRVIGYVRQFRSDLRRYVRLPLE